MSEFGDLEDVIFGMWYVVLFILLVFVWPCSFDPLTIRRAHIDETRMFAGSASISGHTTGPAFTIAGGGSVSVLQGLVFDVLV